MEKEIGEIIKQNRPNISESSINTYISILRTLYKKLDGKDGVKFFKSNKGEIIKSVLDLENNQSKKTKLSALFVLTQDKDYHNHMIDFATKVNEAYKKQKTIAERKENLITIDELKSKYDIYYEAVKKNPSIENYINYFICAVTSTKLMPPRRAEWVSLKIKGVINKDEDNYIDKDYFVFNKFKTAKYKDDNERRVKIPDELKKMINKFKKISDNDYLLYNYKTGKPLDSSTFTKRLNNMYGDKIGVDTIRSIYLTDLYKDLPALMDLEKIADEMGTSINSSLNYYVKKD